MSRSEHQSDDPQFARVADPDADPDAKQAPPYLFVYGTLMAGAAHPMHGRLARGADAHGPVRLRGRLYDIGRYPGVVDPETPEAETWVRGELYRLRAPVGPLLHHLDRYEGCSSRYPEPWEYQRVLRQVQALAAATDPAAPSPAPVAAWVYLYTWPVANAVHIPDGDYLAYRQRQGEPRR